MDGEIHPLSAFLGENAIDSNSPVTYWYEGNCPKTGKQVRLPRTQFAEAIANGLMKQLAKDYDSQEGKMFGILLVETPSGEKGVLKAFSGLLGGSAVRKGWVPSIPGREQVAIDEAMTLARLAAIKQEGIALQQLPEREQYQALVKAFAKELESLRLSHQQRKQQRQQQRQAYTETLAGEALSVALEQLNQESRLDGIQRRQLKRKQDSELKPLEEIIEAANEKMRQLKQERKALSQQLQAQMHASYWVSNFLGESLSLQQLMPGGMMPTGTGECCAPKLLHYAATHRLKPLAMAEFWWGDTSAKGDKGQGQFYGACVERCQPLMGFLLSGLATDPKEVSLLYEDPWLIAVNKPSGLLSVPGRSHGQFDSVLTRLGQQFPETKLMAVHRLDQDTSGILLVARHLDSYRNLSRQFQERKVHKAYEAVLGGILRRQAGVIELPLWGNPQQRPRQSVNWQKGKASITEFQVIDSQGGYSRVEFRPLTGRTHQIRVHAASGEGLGIPILGDRLYGDSQSATRLHLHARELSFQHPNSAERITLRTQTPF